MSATRDHGYNSSRKRKTFWELRKRENREIRATVGMGGTRKLS